MLRVASGRSQIAAGKRVTNSAKQHEIRLFWCEISANWRVFGTFIARKTACGVRKLLALHALGCWLSAFGFQRKDESWRLGQDSMPDELWENGERAVEDCGLPPLRQEKDSRMGHPAGYCWGICIMSPISTMLCELPLNTGTVPAVPPLVVVTVVCAAAVPAVISAKISNSRFTRFVIVPIPSTLTLHLLTLQNAREVRVCSPTQRRPEWHPRRPNVGMRRRGGWFKARSLLMPIHGYYHAFEQRQVTFLSRFNCGADNVRARYLLFSNKAVSECGNDVS